MTAQSIATVSNGVKGPAAQARGGHGVASFINFLDTAGPENFNAANSFGSSTALTTSLASRKLAAKNALGSDSGASSNQNNPPPATPALPLSLPANPVNDPTSAKDAATTSGNNTLAFGAAAGGRAILLTAAAANGAASGLGARTSGTFNPFAGLITAGSTTALAAGPSTDATNSAAGASGPIESAAAQLAQNQAPASTMLNDATPTVTPTGSIVTHQASSPTTTFMVNQFGAPGATSANDPAASAGANDPHGKASTGSDPTQTNGSGSNAATNGLATLPGAAALNARVVAGASNLSDHPIQAATPAASSLTQPSDLEAGMAPPSALTSVPGGKSRDTAGIASTSSNGPTPAGTPSTGANAATDPRNFSAALDHATSQDHGTASDSTADDSKSGAPLNADAANTDSSNTTNPTFLAAQTNAPANSTAAAPTDAGPRAALIAMPVSEQVAINLKQALKTGTDEIQIQLKPASLGTIDVKLNVNHDGRLTAVISTDRSDTLNLLKQDAGNLQQSLRDAGFNADSGSLSFNLRSDTQSFAQNTAPQTPNPVGPLTDLPIASTPSRTLRQHAGAVDIQV